MSGGHFSYKQYYINDIIDSIEKIIENESNEDSEYNYGFSEATLKEFELAILVLKVAEVYAQRIDWLISGDDGEDTFHKRLLEDMEKL